MEIQATLGSDIAMVLDECPPWPCEYDYAARSLEMTLRWAEDAKRSGRQVAAPSNAPTRCRTGTRQMVFGIVQGATFEDLRRSSAQALVAMEFDGYAIGGVSVGEPEPEMMQAVEWSEPHLPEEQAALCDGTRHAAADRRTDRARRGHVRLRAADAAGADRDGVHRRRDVEFEKRGVHARKPDPWRKAAPARRATVIRAPTSGTFSSRKRFSGCGLLSIHNLHFYLELMKRARRAIEDGTFAQFRTQFVSGYRVRGEAVAGIGEPGGR